MRYAAFFILGAILFSFSLHAQVTIRNPQICHDAEGYLKCYNDGSYILNFKSGNLYSVNTSDSSINYNDSTKTLKFFYDSLSGKKRVELTIQLLSSSILIKQGERTLELKDLYGNLEALDEFPLFVDSTKAYPRILIFNRGGKHVEIEIHNLKNQELSWNIHIRRNWVKFALLFNAVKQNRLQFIFIHDEEQKYGMVLSTTLKTSQKVYTLESYFLEREEGRIRRRILEPSYNYKYAKNGKLKKDMSSSLKLCSCKEGR